MKPPLKQYTLLKDIPNVKLIATKVIGEHKFWY